MSPGMFWIGWDDSSPAGERERAGRIVANDLNESFRAWLDDWSAEGYEAQWREGVERIMEGNHVSALVTAVAESHDGTFSGYRWLMYRVGADVILRQQLILPETVPEFDPRDPYLKIHERTGDASQWIVPTSALREFLAR